MLDSVAAKTEVIEYFPGKFDVFASNFISPSVIALAKLSPHQAHAIRAVLKCCDNVAGVNATGASHPHDMDGVGIEAP